MRELYARVTGGHHGSLYGDLYALGDGTHLPPAGDWLQTGGWRAKHDHRTFMSIQARMHEDQSEWFGRARHDPRGFIVRLKPKKGG